jgi:glycosyltransferase involved in cell wall biosynthesis
MRVLLLDLAKTFGGAEVRVLAQAQGLAAHTERCDIATLEGSALHKRVVQDNLPHVVVKSGRGSLAVLTELRHLMRDGKYDIVDAHNVQSILWGMFAARWASVKGRVATIHSDFGAEYPGLKGTFYEGVLTVTRPLTKHVINVTDILQAKSVRQGLGNRASLIPNAVPVPAAPLQTRHSAEEWSFGATDFVVGILARLKAVKGHSYLIDAISHLSDLPYVKLLIVGDGELEATLKEQVERLNLQNRVVFTGFRQDIPHILERVDCVCLASLSEALPYAVLEAASYARPLLLTQVGGLVTLFKHEDTAYLVDSQSAAALAEGLRYLATHPTYTQQLGLNAYQLVKSRFDLSVMSRDVLAAYQKALL